LNAVINSNFFDLEYNHIGLLNSQGVYSVISTWDIQLLKAEINATDTRIRNEIIEKILELRHLKSNWDSYGAVPVSEKAIVNAYYFVLKMVSDDSFIFKRPIVSPGPNGGILLKWRWKNRELLNWFLAEEQGYVYLENFAGERNGGKVSSLNDLLNIIKKWQNS
jgi:hypothetical protein